ncbi:MAG: anti-sigma factor [Taibaiella sp.]|nr:anti-sigma factor [Taibaiella sp.]
MNTQEYIESGILEAYMLGALSQQETAEVEANIALYPELSAEVSAIETGIQHFAELNAEEPPVFMQEQIWNAIQGQQHETAKPAATKVIPLVPVGSTGMAGWQRAAVLVALVGSTLANIVLLSQRNHVQEQEIALQKKVNVIQAQQQVLAAQVSQYRSENDMLADANMQPVLMRSMQKGHPMAATVYWSKDKGDAYLAIQKLPLPPKGMQYQMWVMQKGKPVDMGVLSNAIVANDMVQKLPMQVKEGEAFAISLEKEGGNPTPTMANIYVLGKVSS